MLGFTFDDTSRLVAAAVLILSSGTAAWWAARSHRVFRLHSYWIICWSLVAAWGMVALTGKLPVYEAVAVEALNVSWSCVVIGWMAMLWRKVPL